MLVPHTYAIFFFGTFFDQDTDGRVRDAWGATTIRLTDLALTSDFKHLVAIGMERSPTNPSPPTEATQSRSVQASDQPSAPPGVNLAPAMMIVFDFATKQIESCVALLSRIGMFWNTVLLMFFVCCV